MKCQGFSNDCDSTDAVNFRMDTAYIDEELNFKILCPHCQAESAEYWADRWAEYYAGCM